MSAMQITARVRRTWHVEIPLRVPLEALTVACMALALAQHIARQTDAVEFDRLLTEVEALSEDVAQS